MLEVGAGLGAVYSIRLGAQPARTLPVAVLPLVTPHPCGFRQHSALGTVEMERKALSFGQGPE